MQAKIAFEKQRRRQQEEESLKQEVEYLGQKMSRHQRDQLLRKLTSLPPRERAKAMAQLQQVSLLFHLTTKICLETVASAER